MEQSQNAKIISGLVVIVLVLGVGYILYTKYRTPVPENLPTSEVADYSPAKVVVENTQLVKGVMPLPAGFPKDIPLESNSLTESATTRYPDQNAQQLSVSFLSSKTMMQKYTEYKNYMIESEYEVREGDADSPIRTIFGTKKRVNLSVALSSSKGKTLVQISYLLK